MAYNIPNGSRVYIANKYGNEIKITSASNAEEVVLMVESATGIAKGDIVHVSSVSFQRVPNTAMNEVENVTARFSLKSEMQIYTHAE